MKILKIIFPWLVAFIFIWLFLRRYGRQDLIEIWLGLIDLPLSLLFLSALIGLLSHVIRAIRWSMFLVPLAINSSFILKLTAVMYGYLVNLSFPRAGEIARSNYYSKASKSPFQTVLGSIVAERFVDALFLLLILLTSILVQSTLIDLPYLKSALILSTIILLVVGLLVVLNSEKYLIFKKLKVNKIIEGISSIKYLPNFPKFIGFSIAIWFCYFLLFAIMFVQVEISLSHLFIAFSIGTVAISASNGGLGIYPFLITTYLESMGYVSTMMASIAWGVWIVQTLMVIGTALFLLTISSRWITKLRINNN